MNSIRSYLLSRLLIGAAIVIAAAGFGVHTIVTRLIEEQFDQNLVSRIQGFASILFQVENEVSFEFSDELMPEYERKELPAYFELRFDDGRLIEPSNSLGEGRLELPKPATSEPTFWSAALPDGRPGRFVVQALELHHVYPEEGPDRPKAATVVVAIARGREELVAAERQLLLGCVAVALTLLALLGTLAWLAVNRGLDPANRLASALDDIEIDRLPERLDISELPRELKPVHAKTDALIRRVDSALERERRTTADIAHELRTPISEILTVSEVALRCDHDKAKSSEAFQTIRDVASRMGRSVSTMLKLARLESGSESSDSESIDISDLVSEQLRSLSTVARDRNVQIQNGVRAGSSIRGDRGALRIVVSNLLSNAVYYSTRESTVRCQLEQSNGHWQLWVENEAADLERADLKTLTEPFWRKDSARADGSRSGLGLALSCALAERSGMQIDFDLDQTTFRASVRSGSSNGQSAATCAESTPSAQVAKES